MRVPASCSLGLTNPLRIHVYCSLAYQGRIEVAPWYLTESFSVQQGSRLLQIIDAYQVNNKMYLRRQQNDFLAIWHEHLFFAQYRTGVTRSAYVHRF